MATEDRAAPPSFAAWAGSVAELCDAVDRLTPVAAALGVADAAAAAWITEQVDRPRSELDPPPLVTGDDLLAAGVPPGKAVGAALARIRGLQLDGAIATKAEALATLRGE